MDALRKHRAAQNALRMQLGGGRQDDGPTFATIEGEPLDPKVFSKRFARLSERAGVNVRLDDLRHTYATLGLESGVDIQTISTLMGHSTIGITSSVYLHGGESLQRDAAARIDAVMGQSVTSALAASDGERVKKRVKAKTTGRKASRHKDILVAGTGFEPVTFGL